MHIPLPTDLVTVNNVIQYRNRIADTLKKFLTLPFTEETQCRLVQELRSIVNNAKFDLVPVDALPFPIQFCVGNRKYVIPDIGCTIYVESENYNRLPQEKE